MGNAEKQYKMGGDRGIEDSITQASSFDDLYSTLAKVTGEVDLPSSEELKNKIDPIIEKIKKVTGKQTKKDLVEIDLDCFHVYIDLPNTAGLKEKVNTLLKEATEKIRL